MKFDEFQVLEMPPFRPYEINDAKPAAVVASNMTTKYPKITGSVVSEEERRYLALPTYRLPTTPLPYDRHPYYMALGTTPPPPTKCRFLIPSFAYLTFIWYLCLILRI